MCVGSSYDTTDRRFPLVSLCRPAYVAKAEDEEEEAKSSSVVSAGLIEEDEDFSGLLFEPGLLDRTQDVMLA